MQHGVLVGFLLFVSAVDALWACSGFSASLFRRFSDLLDHPLYKPFQEIAEMVAQMPAHDVVQEAHVWEHKIFDIGDPLLGGQKRLYHSGLNDKLAHVRLVDLKSPWEFDNIAQALVMFVRLFDEEIDDDLSVFFDAFEMVCILERYKNIRLNP